MFSRDHILDILDIAARYYVPIIADEIYEHMVRARILRFPRKYQVTNRFICGLRNKARERHVLLFPRGYAINSEREYAKPGDQNPERLRCASLSRQEKNFYS